MQVISQLRAPAALLATVELLIVVPELVWLIRRREKSVVRVEKRTPYRPALSLELFLFPLLLQTLFMSKCFLMKAANLK